MNATETQPLPSLCNDLGLSLQCSAPPGGVYDSGERAWPSITYAVTLVKDGRAVWSGPYKLGIGHVKIPKKTPAVDAWTNTPETRGFTDEERAHLFTMQTRPHVQFKGESIRIQARLCAKLALFQKVSPKLADVVHSLLSDGAAFFDGQSFEQWAGDFGYDTDSRKAEETYRACDAIGRQLIRGLGRETVEKLREAAQDY